MVISCCFTVILNTLLRNGFTNARHVNLRVICVLSNDLNCGEELLNKLMLIDNK